MMSYGAYDNLNNLAQNPRMHGWISDAASGVWDYFKPMIPWFILTNLVTAVVIWKIASLVCSGRAAVASTKEALGEKLGISN